MVEILEQRTTATDAAALDRLLQGFSVEVVSLDKASIRTAEAFLKPGTEVFVAGLPKDRITKQVEAAVELRAGGMVPVPHIVARNIVNRVELDSLLAALSRDAGVGSALVLGGDRDRPAGDYQSSLQLLESGLFEQNGIRRIHIACYPEGHKRIDDARLASAMAEKLAMAADRGFDSALVSQFCFDARPILAWTRALRLAGVTAPHRVGVAGVASTTALVKFALMCGVGPSLRALQERHDMAKKVLGGETPERVLRVVAREREENPSLAISGAHIFTFGSLAKTIEWIRSLPEGKRMVN